MNQILKQLNFHSVVNMRENLSGMSKYYLWSEDICEIQGLIYSSDLTDKDRLYKIFNDIYLDIYCGRDDNVKLEDKEKEPK